MLPFTIIDEFCNDLRSYDDGPDPEPMLQLLALKVKGTVADRKACPPKIVRPSGKLPGWGTPFEICIEPESNLGLAAGEYDRFKVVRITKDSNYLNPETVVSIIDAARKAPGASAHASLRCTAWSSWQEMSVHKFGEAYAKSLHGRREESRQMIRSFSKLAEVIIAGGGEVSVEWPQNCCGWLQPEL